jgi:hypothetical protein
VATEAVHGIVFRLGTAFPEVVLVAPNFALHVGAKEVVLLGVAPRGL